MEILQKGTIKESDVSFFFSFFVVLGCVGDWFLLILVVIRLRNDLGLPMIVRVGVLLIEYGNTEREC